MGAIIGALAGHGKGAAIGAGAGAGGGALTEILTKGTIKVPAETVLTFRLESPIERCGGPIDQAGSWAGQSWLQPASSR